MENNRGCCICNIKENPTAKVVATIVVIGAVVGTIVSLLSKCGQK